MTAIARGGCAFALVLIVSGCTAPARVATPVPSPVPDREPAGASCQLPIRNVALPHDPKLLPNASRAYRGGTHEGVDFFHLTGGTIIARGEPVLNSCPGLVIRADHAWPEMTEDEYARVTAELKKGPNDGLLDRVRGRQVWVRGDDGTVFRYCHLDSVARGVRAGRRLAAGATLGTVGNTGTSDGSLGTGLNCHLHFEIRPPEGGFLGEGLSAAEARKLYAAFFDLK